MGMPTDCPLEKTRQLAAVGDRTAKYWVGRHAEAEADRAALALLRQQTEADQKREAAVIDLNLDLAAALAEALDAVAAHNADFHHVTPVGPIRKWEAVLARARSS